MFDMSTAASAKSSYGSNATLVSASRIGVSVVMASSQPSPSVKSAGRFDTRIVAVKTSSGCRVQDMQVNIANRCSGRSWVWTCCRGRLQ
eukprot:jgi/Botrbrau1/11337/Bobra.0038s0096.1